MGKNFFGVQRDLSDIDSRSALIRQGCTADQHLFASHSTLIMSNPLSRTDLLTWLLMILWQRQLCFNPLSRFWKTPTVSPPSGLTLLPTSATILGHYIYLRTMMDPFIGRAASLQLAFQPYWIWTENTAKPAHTSTCLALKGLRYIGSCQAHSSLTDFHHI